MKIFGFQAMKHIKADFQGLTSQKPIDFSVFPNENQRFLPLFQTKISFLFHFSKRKSAFYSTFPSENQLFIPLFQTKKGESFFLFSDVSEKPKEQSQAPTKKRNILRKTYFHLFHPVF